MPGQEQHVNIDGETHTYPSKKAMLKDVGRRLLAASPGAMTLRQLYYRFVAADLIENTQYQYDYLGEAIKEARLDGEILWNWIEDRTRSTDAGDHKKVRHTKRLKDNFQAFEDTAENYYRPRWEGQKYYVEAWVEKEALAGVFESVCRGLKVVSFPNRGYTSITMLKEAADRIRRKGRMNGKEAVILYFGDYDPSGQDIERNIREKLNETFDVEVDVERQALTRYQIDKYELPPQPAKKTDSRYEQFVEEHGDMAVELDALPPDELRDLIRDGVNAYFDEEYYEDNVAPKIEEEREEIREWVDMLTVDDTERILQEEVR